ncbi:hypothetical protein GN244_ATG13902 [Phytophthora infestans]|uniref:Uncharacterized protein n=1 Tax=Phytophthora infestans TaxID=4787 RepID=A0A833WQS5_PHYIN|nr:hypothetical protein GN244_ATG13902 [Phytophthora infestans]KAF4128822.1 hypothetical protein GN958_ATG21992 [Phytophthora infestans]
MTKQVDVLDSAQAPSAASVFPLRLKPDTRFGTALPCCMTLAFEENVAVLTTICIDGSVAAISHRCRAHKYWATVTLSAALSTALPMVIVGSSRKDRTLKMLCQVIDGTGRRMMGSGWAYLCLTGMDKMRLSDNSRLKLRDRNNEINTITYVGSEIAVGAMDHRIRKPAK